MDIFEYARIIAEKYKFVTIETTDNELLEEISAEVKKEYPKSDILFINFFFRPSEEQDLNKRRKSKKYGVHINKLNNNDLTVGWWILDLMLTKGWEPFSRRDASLGQGDSSSSLCIDLRKKRE